MWQFIAETGGTYQLKRSSIFDERLDPEKATRAAARFLKFLHARYGDWYLAMAAYNCGAGAVDRAVERTGYADYWELLAPPCSAAGNRELCADYFGHDHHRQESSGLRPGQHHYGFAAGIRFDPDHSAHARRSHCRRNLAAGVCHSRHEPFVAR